MLAFIWTGVAVLGGCALSQPPTIASTTSLPSTQPALQKLKYEFRSSSGWNFSIAISPDGRLVCSEIGPDNKMLPERSGRLNEPQRAELARHLLGWDQLRSSYPLPKDDHRLITITYGQKSISAGPRSETPPLFKNADQAIVRLAVHLAGPDVPMATHGQLVVGVTIVGNPWDERNSASLAFLINQSGHPVRVYVPGFVGPNFSGEKGVPGDRPDAVLESRVGAMFGPGDFVVLRPGEGIVRSTPKAVSGENAARVSAYYMEYEVGKEGEQEALLGVLYPKGEWIPR